MFSFFSQRFFRILPTLIGVTFVSFFLLRAVPGDPVQQMLGERGGSKEEVQKMREALGLDKPLLIQYGLFLKSLCKGNLGKSIITGRSVAGEFFSHFPATLELSFLSLFWSVLLGLPLGVFAALRKRSFWDPLVTSLSLFGFSMSVFWWGLMLILFFSVGLGWLPVSGRISALYDIAPVTGLYLVDSWFSEGQFSAFLDALRHLVLPSLTLGVIPLAYVVRITRISFLQILEQPYIRTAHSKGLGFYRVFFRHALSNAFIPIVTVIGFLAGVLLTGAVLTETVFSWPGIGRWFIQGTLARDYPVITGGVFLMALIIISINLFVDVLYFLIDPRMKKWILKNRGIKGFTVMNLESKRLKKNPAFLEKCFS